MSTYYHNQVISKYIDGKQDTKSDLLQLLQNLSGILLISKAEVEAALVSCQELTMLCDTMTDCKSVIISKICYLTFKL